MVEWSSSDGAGENEMSYPTPNTFWKTHAVRWIWKSEVTTRMEVQSLGSR
jgi:DsbC/DsbD-like thiol-disulfide interchange protein